MCLKHSEAADHRPVLTTPGGTGNRHSKTRQRPDQGPDQRLDSYPLASSSASGHFSEGAGTHLLEPAVQG